MVLEAPVVPCRGPRRRRLRPGQRLSSGGHEADVVPGTPARATAPARRPRRAPSALDARRAYALRNAPPDLAALAERVTDLEEWRRDLAIAEQDLPASATAVAVIAARSAAATAVLCEATPPLLVRRRLTPWSGPSPRIVVGTAALYRLPSLLRLRRRLRLRKRRLRQRRQRRWRAPQLRPGRRKRDPLICSEEELVRRT